MEIGRASWPVRSTSLTSPPCCFLYNRQDADFTVLLKVYDTFEILRKLAPKTCYMVRGTGKTLGVKLHGVNLQSNSIYNVTADEATWMGELPYSEEEIESLSLEQKSESPLDFLSRHEHSGTWVHSRTVAKLKYDRAERTWHHDFPQLPVPPGYFRIWDLPKFSLWKWCVKSVIRSRFVTQLKGLFDLSVPS